MDIEPQFNPDMVEDIRFLNPLDIPSKIGMLWASPPCQCFSVSSIKAHWLPNYVPKTIKTQDAIAIVQATLKIIKTLSPTWWFIENPRGLLRKMPFMFLKNVFRHTITYCQYGDARMKPTDIWTNAYWWKPRPMCKNGDPCHISAPRGSRTGTQGLKNSVERSKIPEQLFHEIFSQGANH